MPITQLKVERLSPISDKPFESVLAAIKSGTAALGPTGLMQFLCVR
jgi:hypothetical protein